MLARREPIPLEFSRPEVVSILQDFYADQDMVS
jgi:ATP sulfurylase